MLSTIERCWFVGIRMFLRRRKCAVWRASDYVRWNDCFKEERAAVTVQVRGIVYYTPSSRGKSTIMVSCLFIEFLCYCRGIVLPTSRIIFRSANSSIERIWIWITSYYHEFSVMGQDQKLKPKDIRRVLWVLQPAFAQMRRDVLRPSGFCPWLWGDFSICHFFRIIDCATPYLSHALVFELETKVSRSSLGGFWREAGRMWITLMLEYILQYELELHV